ncbi:competence/damage-inducible protein CinA [Ruminiclostridium papyrosolvens DSM 2782]|uniref:Putative competence-damage inducible protein n=1 Tax=Ruminiclostridium papyrosolvens DSM 2782 TaxID=588581 RepID=F1TEU9_9FIRM|nr:competence/damage-inducible protein A [Ruminiclostridium papyrosolvens]EGD47265.1 competence/damage-inducible protein CinA [Ruminiclostridium papyrosolvens DSM 2782]WES36304.1 competence/damage-inducible protein A [Ruminiclostridium papyrosolvens DSM 2782]
MKAEILAVGTELLMGQIVNTNAQYISSKLPEAGVGVYYHSVVGDNPDRLEDSLKLALERCDIVITTGGLGPTQDDLTKETISRVCGKKLVIHEESLNKIKNYFSRLGRQMTPNNEKQAYMPEGCIVLKNNNGTAPGCIIEMGEKAVIMLPGPPVEMKPMFLDYVMPYFKNKGAYSLKSVILRVFGIGESAMETKIMDLIDGQTNPTIATYAKEGEVTIRITASVPMGQSAEQILMPVVNEIKRRTGENLYSDKDETLDSVAAGLLFENNITIATAESCTGGLISEMLTDVPGISKVFMGGAVTYSNEAKMEYLGVKEQTLKAHGAVSRETAAEMAEGIRKRLKTDIGISVTGIAGPGGGTDEKPVGLVYVGLSSEGGTITKELRLSGNRKKIRTITALNVFDLIRRHVLKLEIDL